MRLYALNDEVTLAISGEAGRIIGVAHYVDESTQYRVHYKDAHGCAKTDWFNGSQLVATL